MSDLTPERLAEIRAAWSSPLQGTAGVTIRDLLAALDAAEKRIEVLEIGDMTTTAEQWEGAFKAEKRRAERAEKERDKLRALLAFVDDRLIRAQALAEQVAALEKALRDNPTVTIHGLSCDKLDAREIAAEALAGSPPPVTTPTGCRYCGFLAWTVTKYGRVTHKQNCPYRTEPWHQADPLVRQHEDDGA